MKLKLSELSLMSPEKQEYQLKRFIHEVLSPTPEQEREQNAEVEKRIAEFERRYGMTSEEMLHQYQEKSIRQTEDFGTWVFLLEVLNTVFLASSPESPKLPEDTALIRQAHQQ